MLLKKLIHIDYQLLSIFLLIPILSLLVLYSADYNPDSYHKLVSWLPIQIHSATFIKQIVNICIACLALVFGYLIDIRFLKRCSFPIYFLTILLLVFVSFAGIESHGASRWISLGSFRFQPSELAKLSIILILAYYISRIPPKRSGYKFKELIFPVILICIPLVLILLQPDLGTSLSIAGIAIAMLLFVGIRKKIIFVSAIAGILSLIPAWSFVLKPYQKQRILTLFDPQADPLGTGYHVIQSKIAVGSGGLFGKGFMQGSQTQLEFLPEHTTDFAFSVLSEEWGFFGSSIILLLYLYLIMKLLWLSQNSKDIFLSLFCFGFASFIFIHVLVNIGMVLGLLPVVGLPLPFFSYGGSSLLILMFLAGVALNISFSRKQLFE